MKPDIRYFTAIVADLRLAPEEVLFIDDVESNVLVAQRAGLPEFVNADETAIFRIL